MAVAEEWKANELWFILQLIFIEVIFTLLYRYKTFERLFSGKPLVRYNFPNHHPTQKEACRDTFPKFSKVSL